MRQKNKIRIENPFVCINDITGSVKSLNYVIYNPMLNRKERGYLLYKTIKQSMNVKLTPEQLVRLTKYQSGELNKFAEELSEILFD